MANKYSNYELQPYVSTYVNPYSVEVNTILRKRYDDNKASVDLIDKTLGSKQVLEGDQIHIQNAKGMVKNKFSRLTEFGDYENASLVVDEVMVNLETDKGLQYAQQSYTNRQKELDYIQQATMQGFRMLDFGQFNAKSHQSYIQDEQTGAWSKNIYQPGAEKEHQYDQNIKNLIGTIRADASGVSQGKADRIAKNILPGYLEGFIGDQHFRKLTQIEGMSEEEARATILQQIESFTDQQVHYTAKADIKNAGAVNPYYAAYDMSLTTIGNSLGLQTDENQLHDFDLNLISQSGDVFNHNSSNSSPEAIADKNRIMNERTHLINKEFEHAVKTGKLTEDDRDEFFKNMMDPYRGNGTLAQFILYQTQPKTATEHFTEWDGAGPIDHKQSLINAGVGTAGTYGLSAIANKIITGKWSRPMKGKTAAVLATALFGINEIVQYGDKITDPMNNKGGSIFRELNEKGVFGADSRLEVFESNMRKTKVLYDRGIMDTRPGKWVGPKGDQKFEYDMNGEPCNCPFRNGDPFWEQQIKNGKNSMLYMSEGNGASHFETIENIGPIEQEVSTIVPTMNKDGLAAFKINQAGLDNMHITDFNFLGFSEESGAYKKFFGLKIVDNKVTAYKDMQLVSLVPGGIDEGHDAQVVLKVGSGGNYGNKAFATPKENAGMSYIEMAFMNQGRPDLAGEASSFKLLQRMEHSNKGSGRSGGIDRYDHSKILAQNLYNIYQNHLTEDMMTKKDNYGRTMGPLTMEGAQDMANLIIQQKLKQQNKALFDAIDAAYADPSANSIVKQRAFQVLYQQEFLRSNEPITLGDIVQ